MQQYISFLWIWAGQVVSIFGSSLSGFALGVWLYQVTGSASNFALVGLCTVLPQLLVSPLAGELVDRYPRRWMMALGDSGAALCTLAMAILFLSGPALVQPWQVFLVTALSSAFGALQSPAYLSLVPGMVPETQLGRANGLIQLGQGLAEILAPGLAGVLVAAIGVPGVLLIDLATFAAAVSALVLVQSPEKARASAPQAAHRYHKFGSRSASARDGIGLRGLLNGWRAGWDALRAHPGLPGLLRFQMIFTFLWSLFGVLVSPMILGFADARGLGLVLSVAGGGMLAGGLADRVLEPLLLPGGDLASSLGAWIGVGPGRGIAVLCVVIGLIKAVSVLAVATAPGARQLDGQPVSQPVGIE